MKILFLIASLFIANFAFTKIVKAENERGVYFGGGYQTNKISFEDSEAQGTYTTTETTEVIDDDLTVVVDNGDGTHTTTTTTELVDIETSQVGGYLDSNDYFASIFSNFNIFAGVNLNERTSLEIGFFFQEQDKTNNTSNEFIYDGKTTQSTSTLQIISIDMVLNSPLTDEVFDLNVIIGGSSVSFKTETDFYANGVYSESESTSSTDFGINIGIGIDTRITNNVSIRTSINGIMLPASDVIKAIIMANVGIKISL